MIIDASLLKDFATRIFIAAGVREEHAAVIADSLVFAELRGTSSHGVARIPIYVKRIKKGLIDVNANPHIVKDGIATALIDARNGIGQVVGLHAMQLAIQKAKAVGIGSVVVRNSNHYGAAAYFSLMAVEAGMIGFTTTNANPTMAPWGSSTAFFGTNPISVAIPCSPRPIVLDMATSTVARGKIILAARKGLKIPLGWGLTKTGKPTQDPNEALQGTLAPLGGAKGSALAMVVDVLSGVLSGGLFGRDIGALYTEFERPQGVGHFFQALPVECFGSLEEFIARMSRMAGEIKALEKAEGFEEIFLPGEIEARCQEERLRDGIPLDEVTVHELMEVALELGVDARMLAA